MRIWLSRLLMTVCCVCWMSAPCLAAPTAAVFVSFSIPQALLMETLKDSARLHIPATLNGLHQNSMMQTAKLVGALSNQVPNLALQIDPTAFERFGITQVPALVVEDKGCFDVVYGHLPLKEGLERIASHGECGFSMASLLESLHG